ncbi:MAG: hypothetical protein LUE87_11665, partial [Lachnospiraceae bacterium]|nr:hypothetical protein [Lachnospiraceae bacterium]
MKLYIAQNPETEDYEKKWQFCVGSCHASTLLRKDAVELLKRVHDELGIQRVRCHEIFNDDMGVATRFSQIFQAPMGENILEYNFYKVGLAYDNLLSAGMRPFVELSFMPEALAANPTRNFVYGSIPSMPKDLAKWREFMRAFLDYLFHRYGEEEVMQWYFEVWNEPDLPDVFNSGTLNDYFPFYEATARTIREYCPGLKVGGPASSCSSHIDVFVDFCEKNNVPLDFVSTHQYIGEPFIGVEKQVVPLSPEEMKAQQKAMQELRVR